MRATFKALLLGVAMAMLLTPARAETEGRYQIVHSAIDNAVAMAEVAMADIAIVGGGDNSWMGLVVQPDPAKYIDLSYYQKALAGM